MHCYHHLQTVHQGQIHCILLIDQVVVIRVNAMHFIRSALL